MIKVYHTAQRGQTQVALLEGEAGIGKTRLATEFLAWAEMEGADVLQRQAFETGGQLPYRPVIETLRPGIERENAPDDLLSDMWLAERSPYSLLQGLDTASLFHRVILLSAEQDVNTSGFINVLLTLFLTLPG